VSSASESEEDESESEDDESEDDESLSLSLSLSDDSAAFFFFFAASAAAAARSSSSFFFDCFAGFSTFAAFFADSTSCGRGERSGVGGQTRDAREEGRRRRSRAFGAIRGSRGGVPRFAVFRGRERATRRDVVGGANRARTLRLRLPGSCMGSASACFDFFTFVDPIVWVRGGLRRRRETLALKIQLTDAGRASRGRIFHERQAPSAISPTFDTRDAGCPRTRAARAS
jgi:hypothetical protein